MPVNFGAAILLTLILYCIFTRRLVAGNECHREKQFVKVEPDGLAEINPIKVTTATEGTFCSIECLDHQGCNSFAYLNYASSDNCLLSSSVDGASVSGASGVYEIYKKAEPASPKGCQPNPCLSGGTCVHTCDEPFYHCVCPEGTTGQDCTPLYHPFHAKFTTLGANGRTGPTTIGSYYNGKQHEALTTVQNGIQYFTVPYTGVYTIAAFGAAGGIDKYTSSSKKGRGAKILGDFNLEKGQVLKILVGQKGTYNGVSYTSGGGGGTFVATSSNVPLIVAGGGGGVDGANIMYSTAHASTGSAGNHNSNSAWSGGTNGNGATEADSSNSGGGGGGFYTNGRSSTQFGGSQGTGGEGGRGFVQGGEGGRGYRNSIDGGFGGGAGAYGAGGGAGGGGGYSGGASGDNVRPSCGGGGGSYNGAFQNIVRSQGYNSGNGWVDITRINV